MQDAAATAVNAYKNKALAQIESAKLPVSQPFKSKVRSSSILFPKPLRILLQIGTKLQLIQKAPQIYSVILQYYRHQPRIV